MSDTLRRIEGGLESRLALPKDHEIVSHARLANAIELLSNMVKVDEPANGKPLSDNRVLMLEKAIELFDEGRANGNTFSDILTSGPMLAALVGGVEFQGESRQYAILESEDDMRAVAELVSENPTKRVIENVCELFLKRFMRLQLPSFKTVARTLHQAVSDNRNLLSDAREFQRGYVPELGDALFVRSELDARVARQRISDPIQYMRSIGLSGRHLYGEWSQALVLGWLANGGMAETLSPKYVSQLAEYSGNHEYRVVIWASYVFGMNGRADNATLDTCYAAVLEALPDLDNSALFAIEDPSLEPYQVIVDEARGMLRRWINRRILDLYSDQILFDKDRQEFWKSYIENALSVRVAADRFVLRQIGNRLGVSGAAISRNIPVVGGDTALVIEGRTRLFIEIGAAGNATYAYQKTEGERMVERARGRGAEAFKRTSLPGTTKMDTYRRNPNVRLLHHIGWQRDYRRILNATGEFPS